MSGPVYTSTNAGAIWTQATNAPIAIWHAVASSSDGSKLVAVQWGNIFTSTNSGGLWQQASNAPSLFWVSVASSADGNKLVAAANNANSGSGPIYTSTNSGMNWMLSSAPNKIWYSVASSADGNKLAAVARTGQIYTSTDAGANWVSNSAPAFSWYSVASSADGNKLLAAVNNGGIWTLQTTPSPRLNLSLMSSNLALSWVLPSTNIVLQQSADLLSWADVTNPPVLNLTNVQNEVTLPSSGGGGFYRLKTP